MSFSLYLFLFSHNNYTFDILCFINFFLLSSLHINKLSKFARYLRARYLLEARRLARMGDQGDAVADDGDVLDEDAERRVLVGRHLDDVDVELAEELRQSQVLRPGLVQRHLAPRAKRQRDPAEDRVRVPVQRHTRSSAFLSPTSRST